MTREELEQIKGFSREEVYEISETAIKNSRKETAEKFAEMALKEIKSISAKSEYLLEDESVYEDSALENVLEKVKNEIEKEITDKGVQNGN